MGDKLQRGWADEHAKAQERHAENMAKHLDFQSGFFMAQAQVQAFVFRAMIDAEEERLP